jgi:hypothetical protein
LKGDPFVVYLGKTMRVASNLLVLVIILYVG